MISFTACTAVAYFIGIWKRRLELHSCRSIDRNKVKLIGEEMNVTHPIIYKDALDIIVHSITKYARGHRLSPAKVNKVLKRGVYLLSIEKIIQGTLIHLAASIAFTYEAFNCRNLTFPVIVNSLNRLISATMFEHRVTYILARDRSVKIDKNIYHSL